MGWTLMGLNTGVLLEFSPADLRFMQDSGIIRSVYRDCREGHCFRAIMFIPIGSEGGVDGY